MAQSAFVKLVSGSEIATITLDEVKERLLHYRDQLALTAKQLGWEYDQAGFPYTIESKPESDGKWFYLQSTDPLYKFLIFGVGTEQKDDQQHYFIQIVVPDDATHGDKAKGNELCKYLAKVLKAELHLFNGRVMFFNSRK